MLLAKGKNNDITIVKGLENELLALRSRCDMLEKTVKDLQSICDTHQGAFETFRQHIVGLYNHQGMLDSSYQGEVFEFRQLDRTE